MGLCGLPDRIKSPSTQTGFFTCVTRQVHEGPLHVVFNQQDSLLFSPACLRTCLACHHQGKPSQKDSGLWEHMDCVTGETGLELEQGRDVSKPSQICACMPRHM